MWHLDNNLAEWVAEPWRLQLNPADPAGGLRGVNPISGAFRQARVFQVHVGQQFGPPSDSSPSWYPRGNDLIVSYPPTDQTPIQTQIDWRILDTSDVPGGVVLDLVISRQTNLSDIDPAIPLSSSLPGTEWLRIAGDANQPVATLPVACGPGPLPTDQLSACCAFMLRLPDSSLTFVQIFQAVDFRTLDIQVEKDGPSSTLKAVLFRERLEKGVVRRARLRGLLLPRDGDQAVVWRHLRQLQRSIPPLTV